MKPVVLHSIAAAEIEDAVAYYNGVREGFGDEFRDRVEAAIRLIGSQPKAFSPCSGGYRRYVLGRPFPHSIFFIEYDDRVWVATVYDSRRKPDQWKARTPE
jgi:plasmid stabilization system protein ParE